MSYKIKNIIRNLLLKLYSPIIQEIEKSLGGGGMEMLIRKEFLPSNLVDSLHQTLAKISDNQKIFIRLGDGELPVLNKKNGGFHSYSESLRTKLLEAYEYALNHHDFILGVNPNLLYPFTHLNDKSLISSCKNYRLFDFLNVLELKNYANALTLRSFPSHFYQEKYQDNSSNSATCEIQMFNYYKKHVIEILKLLWKGKNVLICEGRFSCFGVYNDLLETAASVHRIQGKNSNAFDEYEKIKQKVLELSKAYPKESIYLICALGHTSKILLTDLHKMGFKMGIDAGNLSITYDCFLHHFPTAWIDDPIQTIAYPPIYYGRNLKQWERYA